MTFFNVSNFCHIIKFFEFCESFFCYNFYKTLIKVLFLIIILGPCTKWPTCIATFLTHLNILKHLLETVQVVLAKFKLMKSWNIKLFLIIKFIEL